jgi:hypothetical protein
MRIAFRWEKVLPRLGREDLSKRRNPFMVPVVKQRFGRQKTVLSFAMVCDGET